MTEDVADGFAPEADLEKALDLADGSRSSEVAGIAAFYVAGCRPLKAAIFAANTSDFLDDGDTGPDPAEQAAQPDLLRRLVGNPFRPISLSGDFLTSNVIAIARSIYEERSFDRISELADALLEAGCDDEDIIRHCRSNKPHARGCWVVDLCLGKS